VQVKQSSESVQHYIKIINHDKIHANQKNLVLLVVKISVMCQIATPPA